jgi:hypothetical protein
MSLAAGAVPQATRGANPAVRPDRKAPKAKFVPMHDLQRVGGFKMVELPPNLYVMMVSEMATLPKGFAGKVPAAQNVIMLTYGAKTGGIVRMYQTPVVKGVDPNQFMKTIANLGIFRDVNRRPGWTFQVRKIGNIWVIPTSSSTTIVENAIHVIEGR